MSSVLDKASQSVIRGAVCLSSCRCAVLPGRLDMSAVKFAISETLADRESKRPNLLRFFDRIHSKAPTILAKIALKIQDRNF